MGASHVTCETHVIFPWGMRAVTNIISRGINGFDILLAYHSCMVCIIHAVYYSCIRACANVALLTYYS